jgi:hypothetical protein
MWLMYLVICVCVGVLCGLAASEAYGAPASQIKPCDVTLSETAWRSCINTQVIAALEGRAEYVQVNDRLAALEATGMSAAQERRVADLAWSKAGDRIEQWKRESMAYTDRWFYDQQWQRAIKLLCYAGVNTNGKVRCP